MKSEMNTMQINRSGIAEQLVSAGTYAGNWKFGLISGKISICPKAKKILETPKMPVTSLSSILDLMQHEQAMKLMRAFKFACIHGSGFEMKIKIVTTPAKHVKWLRIAGVLYYRRWGKPDQMIGIIEDITQRIDEECLSLAIVNHELRNPLTVIKLNIQLLISMLSGKFDQQSLKLLTNVDLHINCMTHLLEEYMTSSLDDQRVPKLNFSLFDLNELIDTMIVEMRIIHPGYRFCKKASCPAWVRADKYKIIQVFINYLTNAVKFSAQSSQIIINTERIGGYVEVAVHDQGIGIPQGQETQIFEKFYQGDQKSVRPKNSKGLGLYLVKNIIEGHGGSVRAEKGKERGAVFFFSLPAYDKNESKQVTRIAIAG